MSRPWLAGCLASLLSLPAAAAEPAALVFENVWVRAMPPFQTVTAGYFTVTNRSASAVAIVGARCNVAKKAEVHATRMVDGVTRMEPVEALAVAPGERVEFTPGGLHLMLFDIPYRLVADDDVRICLQLVSGEETCADAEVRRDGETRATAGNHQH